jgi:hypothetical protein
MKLLKQTRSFPVYCNKCNKYVKDDEIEASFHGDRRENVLCKFAF